MTDLYCYNNFAITALGRSGTKFLSYYMNTSPTWEVLHEPNKNTKIDHIQGRFNKNNYGEVNSFLRWSFSSLVVKTKGVIIRNPYEIALSYYNRVVSSKKEFTEYNYLHLKEGLEILDRLIESKVYCIRFEKMVKDLDYLNEIIRYFGIEDIKIDKIEKVNETKVFLVDKVPNVSLYIDWFYNKYYFIASI